MVVVLISNQSKGGHDVASIDWRQGCRAMESVSACAGPAHDAPAEPAAWGTGMVGSVVGAGGEPDELAGRAHASSAVRRDADHAGCGVAAASPHGADVP